MAISTRIEPINRDIELMLSEELSPQAQSKLFAQFAGEQIDEAKKTNQSILGRMPRYSVTVDGSEGASLSSVRPDGVVIVEFELVNDAMAWIGEQLVVNSPVGQASEGDPHPGLYQRSHTLFADGIEIDVGAAIPAAEEYVFINTQPYARKIERGSSSQAPDGVYQAVAMLAARRFGNIAKISFGYRAPFGGVFLSARAGGNKSENRQPAIIVRTPN